MPAISIGIPTYNSAHFLTAAIASVMNQGLEDFEIVISDNASQDDTEAVVRALGNLRIRYYRNASNLGSRENINRCLELVRGDYIKILCADDVLLDGIIAKQVRVLEQRPEVSLVSCDMFVTDAELKPQEIARVYPGWCPGARLIAACLAGLGNYIGGPSNFMFRRRDAAALSLDPSYRWLSDLKFGFQLLERGAYFNIGEPGYFYRRHAATDSALHCPPELRLGEYVRLVDEFRGWTLINCLQSARRGGFHGLRAVGGNWIAACSPARLQLAFSSAADVLRMRRAVRSASQGKL